MHQCCWASAVPGLLLLPRCSCCAPFHCQVTGLAADLRNGFAGTLFAPTNDAFAALLESLDMPLQEVLEDREILTSVGGRYVLPGAALVLGAAAGLCWQAACVPPFLSLRSVCMLCKPTPLPWPCRLGRC